MLRNKQTKWKPSILLTGVALLASSILTAVCWAAPGDLDLSFGTSGIVVTDIMGPDDDFAEGGVVIQPDGKIVVAGYTDTSRGSYFALARYETDGMLDASFGTDGRATTPFISDRDKVYAAALQADGRIVVAGRTNSGDPNYYDFVLVRFDSNGSLDTSFGAGGKVTTDFTSGNEYAYALDIRPDGKIVVAGRTNSGDPNYYDFALACYETNGSLDTSFGTGGLVTTHFSSSDCAYALAIHSNRIIVAGSSGGDIALARYDLNGDLDTSFGIGGIVTTDFTSGNDYAYALAIQADGKIVVAGQTYTSDPNGHDFALARYNSNGSLDGAFGASGLVTTDFDSSWEEACGLAIQAGGKIVVAGHSDSSDPNQDFALARYNSDGSLDSTFDTDGLVTTSFSSSWEEAYGLVLQADGKIVAAGSTDSGEPNGYDFAVARYNSSDGSLDTTFDSDGKVTTNFVGSNYNYATAITIQADGKLVVAGNSNRLGKNVKGVGYDFALARYQTDGSLDTSFGIGGAVITGFGSRDDHASAVVIQADGRITVAGDSDPYRVKPRIPDFALARYETDGMLDASFGTNGLVLTNFGPGTGDFARDAAIQDDGKMVVVGYMKPHIATSTWEDFALARYEPNGSLDTSFGTDGLVITDFNSSNDYGQAVAIQDDGKIVVAGTSRIGTPSGRDFALARYNPNGSLDISFDADGLVTTDFGSINESVDAVAIQPDGKIVVAGDILCDTSGGWDFALSRYNTDGTLDMSFGTSGLVLIDFASIGDFAADVAIQCDGKIIVVGETRALSNRMLALACCNSDGTLDSSFGTAGKVVTDLGPTEDIAGGIALQGDGKIVLAGIYYDQSITDTDFALARYENPSMSDVDGDGVCDLSDICPADPCDECDPNGSTAEEIDANDGGTVETPDGDLTIDIDPCDLAEDTTISVTETVPGDPNVDLMIGPSPGLGVAIAVYDLEPDGIVFNSPVTITVTADVTNLNENQRNRLKLYLWDDNLNKFVPVEDAVCDVVEDPPGTFIKTCTAELEHFSTIAMVAPLDSDNDGIPDLFEDEEDHCPELAADESVLLSYTGDLLVAIQETGGAIVTPSVVLTDENNDPLADVPVSFTITDSGGNFDGECSASSNANGLASCSLTGLEPDVYTVTAESGELGCPVALTEAIVVVFDPSVPRATGGGFILPDAESTWPAESDSDKANFGFIVRLDKNQAAAGNLEFQYKTAGINLKSQSMAW
ncbi:MAG: hypothetical protein ACYS76_13070, partial [Planctomycetota bacterium]